jgi:hypothetical protein
MFDDCTGIQNSVDLLIAVSNVFYHFSYNYNDYLGGLATTTP